MSKYRLFLAALLLAGAPLTAVEAKQILMIAGNLSHGPGQHEHRAGIKLFEKCLNAAKVDAKIEVFDFGKWPSVEQLKEADTVVIYADGGRGHPALKENRLEELKAYMAQGKGLVCVHYGVEPTTEKGNAEFIEWMGGCFETHWSVNPHWTADFKTLPEHAITRGVKPFSGHDEWYFHMRFRKDMKGVSPILSAVPPESTLERADGPHSGNPVVREEVKAGKAQHVAWAAENEDGSRGFGFTGGHFHASWANDDQRKLLLNAILWTAKIEVPQQGVDSVVTEADMKANLDLKRGQGLP